MQTVDTRILQLKVKLMGKLLLERGSSRLSADTKSRLPRNAVAFNVGDSTLINGDLGSRRLIPELEMSGMEEDGCAAAGPHWDTSILALRQKEMRLHRMAQFLAAGLLVLISVSVALLITVVHEGLGGRPPDRQFSSQPTMEPACCCADEQRPCADFKNPSAMLTAPIDPYIGGPYLEWESKKGLAFCHGGFNYSNGNLVVPRSGIYRVFLQITYQSKSDHKCKELGLTTTVYVFRDTYTQDMSLLSSVDTISNSMEPWNKSLYTAGLFFLEANCLLRVKSSHPHLIVKKEYQVFFGAELLS